MEEIKGVRGGVEDFPDLVFSNDAEVQSMVKISLFALESMMRQNFFYSADKAPNSVW